MVGRAPNTAATGWHSLASPSFSQLEQSKIFALGLGSLFAHFVGQQEDLTLSFQPRFIIFCTCCSSNHLAKFCSAQFTVELS